MTIQDNRKNATVNFGTLRSGELFAIRDFIESNETYYFMKLNRATEIFINIDTNEGIAVCVGVSSGEDYYDGTILPIKNNREVEPLLGDLKLYSKI